MSNERALLHVLGLSQGRAVRLTILVVEVQSVAKQVLTTMEVTRLLDGLESKHQVSLVRSQDAELKAMITDDGLARLAGGA